MAIAANPLESFIWGAGGAKKTPEQVAREREIAQALMANGADFSPVDHWLQGAARAAQAGVGAFKDWRASNAEQAGREGYQSRWDNIFGSSQTVSADPVASALMGAPQTASDATAALASVPSGDTAGYIRNGLIQRGLPEHVADAFLLNFQDESGLNSGINEAEPVVPGSRGGYGLYQLTGPRRVAYEQYAQQLGVDPSNVDAQLDFMMSELQGPEAAAAQAILSAPDTGSAAAAIVNKFLRPAEEHRARRVAQYTGGGGAGQQVAQALMGGGNAVGGASPSMQDLIGLASDPWANDAQKAIVQSLLGQQMQQQDPMYQLQMQAAQQGLTKGDLEIQQLLNPQIKPVEVNGRLVNPATGEVIADYSDPNTATVGNSVIDVNTGLPIYEGQPEPTTDMQNYDAYAADEIAAGRQPVGRMEYEQAIRASGATNITNNLGGTDEFYKKLDTDLGAQQVALIEAGQVAQGNNMRLGQLEQHLTNAPQGAQGALVQFAGSLGLPMEGLSDVQAAQAIINQMVPGQRPPGSGTMSDADLALFKQSLPSIMNQPGGNTAIIQTTRAINDYMIKQAEIARMIANREVTPAEGRAMQAAIPNPLAQFQAPGNTPAAQQSQAKQVTTEAEYNALPSGSVYMDPTGQIRTKR